MARLATNYDISTLRLAMAALGHDFGSSIDPSDVRLALRKVGIESGEAINDSDIRLLLRAYVRTLPNIREGEVNPVADNILNGVTTIESTTKKFGGVVPNAPNPAPDPPTPNPPTPPPPPNIPDPDPPPGSDPDPVEPIDYRARVRTLFPFFPAELADIYADAWAETGDTDLALAEMRSSAAYETYYPKNRRPDGTIRHTEAEYSSIKDAYRTLYRDFNLNPDVFENRFTELIEHEQSPAEHARKLGAVYEGIVNNIPEMRQVYAEFGGIELSDEAIFASVIDPTVGEAIVNHRISVASVAAEGRARGFSTVDQPFAERLANAGVNQQQARQFFAEAEDRVPTFDELARRFRAGDFDVEDFAEASVFGGAAASRKIERLLAAEASTFTDQLGSVATGDAFELTGLSAR